MTWNLLCTWVTCQALFAATALGLRFFQRRSLVDFSALLTLARASLLLALFLPLMHFLPSEVSIDPADQVFTELTSPLTMKAWHRDVIRPTREVASDFLSPLYRYRLWLPLALTLLILFSVLQLAR